MRGRHVSGCNISLLAAMFFVAAVSGSCSLNEPATEVMLVIEAETQAKMRGVELQVDIEGRNTDQQPDGMPITRAFHPKETGAATWPIELAITPRGGDAKRSFSVTATLFDNSGAIAVQRVRSGFVAKKTLALHLILADDCLKPSLGCNDTETCLLGSCVDAFIDPNELLGWPDGTGLEPDADGGIGDTSSSMEPAVMSAAPASGKGGSKSPGAAGSGSPSKPGSMQPGGGGTGGMGAMGQPDGAPPQTDKPGDCGDGIINPGEKCDSGIGEGQKGSCPTACPAEDACHPATLEGDGCQTRCMAYAITAADSGDGCCPPGTDAKDDTDCGALCGNGVQEAGEKCDPVASCPTVDKCQKADACLRATIAGEAAQCNAECVMEPIAECVSGDGCCPESCTHATDTDCSTSCGDGVVDRNAGELCERESSTPCPTTCTDTDVCTRDVLLGSEKNCNSVCTHVPILVPVPGDGCCPSGANANSDFDCKAVCGNGIVELGERCDGRCPKAAADCEDGDPCTRDAVEGSGCAAHCVHPRINTAAAGDKCCPRGANANNDSDCSPVCGNGVTESGEQCDGADCMRCGDNNTCTRDIRGGGNCDPTCTYEPITAPANDDGCCLQGQDSSTDNDCKNGPPPKPTCPNGTVDPDENCDPSVAGSCETHCDDGVACTDDAFTPGKDACHGTCSHLKKATPECMPPAPTCMNGKLDPGETCDPMDAAHPCPTSCDDQKNCTTDTLTGSARTCDVECTHSALPNCCPTGEDEWQNSSCSARCGNDHVETGETCDGSCPACPTPAACTRAVPGGSACNPTCTTEPIENCCPPGQDKWEDPDCPARCGNGHVEGDEECDNSSETCLGCRTVTAPPPPPPPPPDPPVGGAEAPAP